MLEVINSGSTELPHSIGDSSMMLSCWEKTPPLIKELERTVNFAERKCGDLMQQLHFYKEYYEKWAQAERLTNNNIFPKKKAKKCCKHIDEAAESSSDNEFEKVNQYFYKKIRGKITEMNRQITQANRKLHIKFEEDDKTHNENLKPEDSYAFLDTKVKQNESKQEIIQNKGCKSEPTMLPKQEESSLPNENCREFEKGAENQSIKSMPTRIRKSVKSRTNLLLKRAYPSLQRYKLRSKSLPQGVRRKFGFGGFIEVMDSKASITRNRSKSRTTIRTDSHKSMKIFEGEAQPGVSLSESKNRFFCKMKRLPPNTSRSLQYKTAKTKLNARPYTGMGADYYMKSTQSESVIPKNPVKMDKNNETRNMVSVTSQGDKLCQDVVPSNNILKNSVGSNGDSIPNLSHLVSKPNSLVPFLRHPIPFIACSSTSKTFNLGLNVQQVLSLIKHKKHSITLRTVIKNGMQAAKSVTDKLEPTVNTLFFSRTSHSQVTSSVCPARACIDDSFSIVTDDVGCRSSCALLKEAQAIRLETIDKKNDEPRTVEFTYDKTTEMNKLQRPEDVWVVEQPDPNSKDLRRSASRCTCYPSKHCVDYQKVLKQYTGWRYSSSKASFRSDTYSSCPPMMAYQKPKLCPIPSQENIDLNFRENGRLGLMRLHNDMLNLNRKYTFLEEQISQKNLEDYEVNAELDAMESELTAREMEFKDVLNFYQQLVLLKRKLKTLRTKSINLMHQETQQQTHYQRPRRDPLRPTPSMTLSKVLRKIQGLQDKIKLIDVP